MPQWLIWTISLAIFVLLVIIQVIVHSKNPVKKAISGIIVGILTLTVVNISGIFTGVTLPISILSLGVSAIAGIPGVTMLLLLNLIA